VIVGDSESDGRGAAPPTGPGGGSGIAAVGAMDWCGEGGVGGAAGGGIAGDEGEDRPRFNRLSEKLAVEPTGEKPSAARRSSASSAASE
jgi:hypothetical protein